MRKATMAFLTAGLLLASCTTAPGAVRGFQAPGGEAHWAMVGRSNDSTGWNRNVDNAIPGAPQYVAASADGSVIGFLYTDGSLRWFRTK